MKLAKKSIPGISFSRTYIDIDIYEAGSQRSDHTEFLVFRRSKGYSDHTCRGFRKFVFDWHNVFCHMSPILALVEIRYANVRRSVAHTPRCIYRSQFLARSAPCREREREQVASLSGATAGVSPVSPTCHMDRSDRSLSRSSTVYPNLPL